MKQIKAPKNTYFAIYSEPCFEYFLLLHFIKTDKPFTKFDELRRDKNFRKHFPKYNKTDVNIFNNLKDKMPFACTNAKNNQHTNINELIEYLQNLKNR
ncbi:MAG: RloB domain-containing protein [Candidatus Thioglobus sp.]|nr:RloB domain-containing protein [Candidatus Thioglobus sp.]